MFKLADGRKYLYQWDIDIRLLAINEEPLDEIHFSISNGEVYRSEIQHVDDMVFAKIPNILLQQKNPIFAMPYCHTDNGIYTKGKYKLEIIPRPKPDDYIIPDDDDIKTWYELEKRIEKLEENDISDQIDDAVNDYLDNNTISIKVDNELSKESENPVQNKVIANKISQIEADINDKQPIGNYATKAELSLIPKFSIKVVDILPNTEISNTTVYLIPSDEEINNMYTEYIFIVSPDISTNDNGLYDGDLGKWEILGTQELDLSDYVKESELMSKAETWVFTLEDGSTITKKVVLV